MEKRIASQTTRQESFSEALEKGIPSETTIKIQHSLKHFPKKRRVEKGDRFPDNQTRIILGSSRKRHPFSGSHQNPTFSEALSKKRRVEKGIASQIIRQESFSEALEKGIPSQTIRKIQHSRSALPKSIRLSDNHQN